MNLEKVLDEIEREYGMDSEFYYFLRYNAMLHFVVNKGDPIQDFTFWTEEMKKEIDYG